MTEREARVKEIVLKRLETHGNTEGTYAAIYKEVNEWYYLNSSRFYYAAKVKILIKRFYNDYMKQMFR